jgi:hypothetical protein
MKPGKKDSHQGQWFQDPPGPGTFLSRAWRSVITQAVNVALNTKYLVPVNDGNTVQFQEADVKMSKTGSVVTFPDILKAISAGGGFNWQVPAELDTSRFVPADTYVYITAGNALVTSGMTDIVSNATVISCEGIWQARKDVSAATGGKYNVPVFPYPNATGVVTGAAGALKGDMDDDGIFWRYWGQVAC